MTNLTSQVLKMERAMHAVLKLDPSGATIFRSAVRVVYGSDSASDTTNTASIHDSEDEADKVISDFQKTIESIAQESTPTKAPNEATGNTSSRKKHALIPRPSTSPDEPEQKTKKVKLTNTTPMTPTKSSRVTRSAQSNRKNKEKGGNKTKRK